MAHRPVTHGGSKPRLGGSKLGKMFQGLEVGEIAFRFHMNLERCQTVTPEATMLWAQRSWKDHCKKAPADAPAKQKDWKEQSVSLLKTFSFGECF